MDSVLKLRMSYECKLEPFDETAERSALLLQQ